MLGRVSMFGRYGTGVTVQPSNSFVRIQRRTLRVFAVDFDDS